MSRSTRSRFRLESSGSPPPSRSGWPRCSGPGGSFGDNGDFGDYWPVLVIIGVLAAIIFGVVVPRGLSGAWPTARTGLILSVLGLLTVIAFWSGAPPIFAFAGILLGYVARQRGQSGLATAAVAIGVLALVADIAIYIGDQAG